MRLDSQLGSTQQTSLSGLDYTLLYQVLLDGVTPDPISNVDVRITNTHASVFVPSIHTGQFRQIRAVHFCHSFAPLSTTILTNTRPTASALLSCLDPFLHYFLARRSWISIVNLEQTVPAMVKLGEEGDTFCFCFSKPHIAPCAPEIVPES